MANLGESFALAHNSSPRAWSAINSPHGWEGNECRFLGSQKDQRLLQVLFRKNMCVSLSYRPGPGPQAFCGIPCTCSSTTNLIRICFCKPTGGLEKRNGITLLSAGNSWKWINFGVQIAENATGILAGIPSSPSQLWHRATSAAQDGHLWSRLVPKATGPHPIWP
jgi:hypothetical protein